jgi:hypothetical protein
MMMVMVMMMTTAAKTKEKKQKEAFTLAAQEPHIYLCTMFVCLWTPPATLLATVTALTASNTTQIYFD